jgi:hypothetical protein
MQYFMKPATPSSDVGRMHTARGLKMALPQSGTLRLVAGSGRKVSCGGSGGGERGRGRWVAGAGAERHTLRLHQPGFDRCARQPPGVPAAKEANRPRPTQRGAGRRPTCSSTIVCM